MIFYVLLKNETVNSTLGYKFIFSCTILTLREKEIWENHSLYIRYFNQNYALKLALPIHANTQNPDEIECN